MPITPATSPSEIGGEIPVRISRIALGIDDRPDHLTPPGDADPHIAEQAAQAIEIGYEPMPAVFDEVEALSSAVFVHDQLKPAGTFADLKHLAGRRDTNIALDFHLRRGDPAKAFANAEQVFEHTFRTQQTMHTPLEPNVAVSDTRDGSATIYSSTQNPSFVRTEIARLLGWPENRVPVAVVTV